MSVARELARELDRRLRAASDRERKRFTEGYFPSALENLGVGAPVQHRLAREFARRLAGESPAGVLAFTRAVLAQRTLEGRQVAYLVLQRRAEALASFSATVIEALGRGIDNWASVDTFACSVAGPAWRDGRVRDSDVRRWSRARDRWWRRTALVATVPLNAAARGGSGDARRTLAVCRALAAERDDMVVKALSWALRALGARAPGSVRAFLAEHGDVLHARVVREVRNKLTTGRKTPARRAAWPAAGRA